jgi:DNA-binding GntR family transcriptional regulator
MPRRLWDEVRDDIEEHYLTTKAGTEVPGFDTLAADFGTSPPTVKKALDQLIVEGFMTYRATTGLVFTGFQAAGVPQKGELHQVLEVRLSLEPVAARLAANGIKEGAASRQDVDAFEKAYVKLSDAFAQKNVMEAFQADRNFHASSLN